MSSSNEKAESILLKRIHGNKQVTTNNFQANHLLLVQPKNQNAYQMALSWSVHLLRRSGGQKNPMAHTGPSTPEASHELTTKQMKEILLYRNSPVNK